MHPKSWKAYRREQWQFGTLEGFASDAIGRPWTFGSIDGSSTSLASKSCSVDHAMRHVVGKFEPLSFDQPFHAVLPSQSHLRDRGCGLHVKRGPRAAKTQ